MVALYGGSAPAQLQRSPGTANPVQGFWAEGSALAGANLTTALPSNVLMEAGGGGAYLAPAVTITVSLAVTEAQDIAAANITVGSTSITADLAATEAQDIAAIGVTVSSANVTVALAATEAQDIASIQITVPQPIIVDDTHDGDYLPRKFKRERDERRKRKRDIINAYEVLVEGKSPVIEELIAQYADPEPKQAKATAAPRLDIDKIMQSADAIERLWNAYIDMDDEEILLLL
jgi:hypothetical protein